MTSSISGLHLIILLLVTVGGFALWISALISVSRQAVTTATRVVWIIVVFLLPLLGPILWFLAGRPAARGPHQS